MVALKCGDLVWTLEQQYALVLKVVGDQVTLLMGDGRVITETPDRLFPVDVHGSLVDNEERPAANFRPALKDSEARAPKHP